ncbi:MAG: hypothetical protein N2167_01350 [Flavobacteriales bacterium]|nr:hypothetical protein [Flavobacteriales bacterium]
MIHNLFRPNTNKASIENNYPWISITSFGVMILSFLFTFCAFTCSGERISEKTYSGIDIMTMRLNEEAYRDLGIADIITGIAFFSAITGFVFSMFRKKNILIALIGFIGVFFLMVLYVYIKYRVRQSSEIMVSWIEVKFKIGYFIAIISGLLGSLWNLRKHLETKKASINQRL